MQVGGVGMGVMEGFASFMAEAAMKNSAKARLGDAVKIGKVSKKCEWKTVSLRVHGLARKPAGSAARQIAGHLRRCLSRLQPASRRAASAMSAVVPA